MNENERVIRCHMRQDCESRVTHIDMKGWVYCAEHGNYRKFSRPCRKLRAWEIALLKSGEPIPSYDPISLKEYRERIAAKAQRESMAGVL